MRVYRLTQGWVEDRQRGTSARPGSAWASPGADGAASNAGVPLTATARRRASGSIDVTPVRPGMEQRHAQPRNRVHRRPAPTGSISPAANRAVLAGADGGLQEQTAAGRHPAALGDERHRHVHHGPADRSDLLLERSRHGHGRPARLGAVGLRADHRRRLAGRRPCWCRRPTARRAWPRRRRCRRAVSNPDGGSLTVSVTLGAAARSAGVHDHRAARHAALLGSISADLHLADTVDRQQQGGPQHRVRHPRRGHRRAQQQCR